MVIDNEFNLKDIVYLITDSEQLPRFVCEIQIYDGGIMYRLCNGAQTSSHYTYEISKEKNIITTI